MKERERERERKRDRQRERERETDRERERERGGGGAELTEAIKSHYVYVPPISRLPDLASRARVDYSQRSLGGRDRRRNICQHGEASDVRFDYVRSNGFFFLLYATRRRLKRLGFQTRGTILNAISMNVTYLKKKKKKKNRKFDTITL